jgi:hypothetical protein
MTAHQSIEIRFDCDDICEFLRENGKGNGAPPSACARARNARRGTGRCGLQLKG